MDPKLDIQKCPSCAASAVELMTAKEVAAFLKISIKTVYAYAERGTMPVYWRFQRNVRFEKRQIMDWMQRHNQASRFSTNSNRGYGVTTER